MNQPDHPLNDSLVQSCREQFPALSREFNGEPLVYLDGPAGTQVPQRVIDAISGYLGHCNANHGGHFPTSHDSDEILHQSHQAMADFLGASDPDEVVFGPNMTTLTFAFSRAIAQKWNPGDEIIVTRLDHDANVSPWVLAARDAGVTVHYVDIRHEDVTLDTDHLQSLLSEKTRLLAIGHTSNSSGSINPVKEVTGWAHAVGAEVFVDAVHHGPHGLIDVGDIGCDYLACSAYKFFGPHIGIIWSHREILESLEAYKVRPSANTIPDKWMTGTQNHECLAGTTAAVDYLADLGRTLHSDEPLNRRQALCTAFSAIRDYENKLAIQLIQGLTQIDGIKIHGITDSDRVHERVPTVTITHNEITTTELAKQLGSRGICAWHGNYYALQITEALGLEPEGMIRLGLVHYNTAQEVDRLLNSLSEIVRQ
ncbi:MAG: cysteine desulfurase-like protein [Pirellulaceae bacterium]